MPRATSPTEKGITKERTPRRRATAVSSTVAAPRPVRQRRPSSQKTEGDVSRKAPTTLVSKKPSATHARRQVAVIFCMVLAGLGGSAAVGFTDEGVIDVNKTIEQRNEETRARGGSEEMIVPIQNTNPAPDGGLVGFGIGGPENQPPATTTASTTPAASSSEAVGQAPLSNTEADAAAAQTENEASAETQP